eukprot:TRINITY_DN4090_c0_g3_i2.p2 TRINITY_DN4090_c0_g3~~TRINITY_DN4090_c0_g3_i2.p2  ORF type:complete len:168 (-),score=23.21 TRINITY_DN4090_c0_g3_i2:3369-3872(-)
MCLNQMFRMQVFLLIEGILFAPENLSLVLALFALITYLLPISLFLATIHSLSEPQSYKEAIATPEWRSAIEEELAALQKTNTWELVPSPPDKNIIGCKWVFKLKTKSDGSIDRYKARLVAKGYNQEYGIEYEETFAPVAKMTIVRTFILVAVVRQWPLYQLDVKMDS